MAENKAQEILYFLAEHKILDSYQYACEYGQDHQMIVGAIKSLQSLGDVVQVEQLQSDRWVLTDEGKDIVKHGSHEARVFYAINPEKGTLQSELMSVVSNAEIGFKKAMSSNWISIEKDGMVFRKVPTITDTVQEVLKKISHSSVNEYSEDMLKEYKKRKLIAKVVVKNFVVTQGESFSTEIVKQESELTADMIQTGSWRSKHFKLYNFDAFGTPLSCGHLHPLMKVRTEIRQIFLEMGFTEMPTNTFTESSFWNFDALFQPQQHPARDAHDTFFLKDPQYSYEFPMEYLERVKKVHQTGGYGSTGYNCVWKLEEAQKNILRTHTTAVSARMLYKLGQQKEFQPVKYFSIDRVFRNETLDATHLAEFHQIEGVVADYDLTLGDLMGSLHAFFSKMGIERLRFKPTYNPYTEPSMEVFSYHDGLKKWVEVGNSGVFRPEMLLPMGLPENVSVIAWGLSLERPTMIKYGYNNIRDLVGHKVNLEMVYKTPICRLDK